MIGKWRNNRLLWPAISNKAGLSHEQSVRGVCEAAVAELDDGRCLMLMRMSNHGIYEDRESGDLIALCPNSSHATMKQAHIERCELPIALFDG